MDIDDEGCKIRMIGIKDSFAKQKKCRTKIADEKYYDEYGYFLLDDFKCFRIDNLMDLPSKQVSIQSLSYEDKRETDEDISKRPKMGYG